MMVSIVVLLVVLVLLEAVVAWALLRPLMALGRMLEAGASVAESVERIAGKLSGPTTSEVIRDAGETFGDAMRRARHE